MNSTADELTVNSVRNITGRSACTVRNLLSLLKLPQEVIRNIEDKKISPSNGYALAFHIGHDHFNDIVNKVIQKKPTREELSAMFDDSKQNHDDARSNRYSYFLQRIKGLKDLAKIHSKDISEETMDEIYRKFNEIFNLMKEREKFPAEHID